MLRAIPILPRPVVAGKCAPGKPQALKKKGRGFMTSSLPYALIHQRPRREILGSPGRSESQQLVSDSCNKRSIRGVAKGQKCLCPTRIGLGTGPRGGDCYRELRRIPIFRDCLESTRPG